MGHGIAIVTPEVVPLLEIQAERRQGRVVGKERGLNTAGEWKMKRHQRNVSRSEMRT